MTELTGVRHRFKPQPQLQIQAAPPKSPPVVPSNPILGDAALYGDIANAPKQIVPFDASLGSRVDALVEGVKGPWRLQNKDAEIRVVN